MALGRDAIATFGARGFRAVLAIITLVAFVAVVGSGAFGTFVLFEGVLNVAAIGVNAGLGAAIQQRVGSNREADVPATAVALKLLFFAGMSAVLVIASPWIHGYLGASLVPLLILALGVRELARIGVQTLRGEQRVPEATALEAGGDAVVLAVGVALGMAGWGVSGLAIAFTTGWVVVAVGAFARFDTPLGTPSVSVARSLLSFAKFNAVASVLGGNAYSWVDTLVIGAFLSPALVTAYEVAWRVSAGVLLLAQAIGQVTLPEAAALAGEDKEESIKEFLPDALTGALVLVPPAIVGAALLGAPILRLATGPVGGLAAIPLVILLVGRGFEAANDVIARVLLGIDQPRTVAIAATVFLIVNVAGNLLLVPRFGLEGAAVATVSAVAVNASLNGWFLSTRIPVRIPWRPLAWSAVAAVVMGAVLREVAPAVSADSSAMVGVLVVVGGVLYAGVLLASPLYREKAARVVLAMRAGRETQ